MLKVFSTIQFIPAMSVLGRMGSIFLLQRFMWVRSEDKNKKMQLRSDWRWR